MKLTILVILAVLATAGADSAVLYEFPDGRTVALMDDEDLVMDAESVFITPVGDVFDSWPAEEGGFTLMRVHCVFHLRNASETPRDVAVGFPFDAKYGNSYTVISDSMLVALFDSTRAYEGRLPWISTGPASGPDETDIPEQLDFVSVADGETLEVFFRKCAFDLEEDLVWNPTLAVWRMHFEPGQEIRLVNTYNTSWDYQGYGTHNHTMNYIVTSGATWAGSIGEAFVRLEVPLELPLPQLSDTLVASWEWSGDPVIDYADRTVTWEYEDWEPQQDLTLRIHSIENAGVQWDYVSAEAMDLAIEWTRERLLSSAARYLWEEFSLVAMYRAEFVLNMSETLLFVRNRIRPPRPAMLRYFSSNCDFVRTPDEMQPSDLEKLQVIEAVRQDLESDVALIEEAGLLEFLPIFVLRYNLNVNLAGMWERDPAKREALEELLEAGRALQQGELPVDPVHTAFFRLTGDLLLNGEDYP